MKRYTKIHHTLFAAAIVLALALPVGVWLLTRQFSVATLFTGIGSLLLLLLFVLADKNNDVYLSRTIIQLSELIASITELREQDIFPDTEDTLLSKLQGQVVKLTNILQAQNRTAAQEKEEIQSLISDISHQIKTPVAALKMYGELLQEHDLSQAQQTEYLNAMETALNKLTFLTDSLIKMSRLESGVIQLRPTQACLNETVLAAVMQAYHPAKNKHIDISFEEKNGRVSLLHDTRWTTEAIFNLLDNAVKYTPVGGRIAITLQTYEIFARLDIQDNGIGIPESEQSKIWKRFYRGRNVGEEEGVGIGLYLCRKIIQDQGGQVRVCSHAQGSTFSLFLPLN